jgi:hypothetical protein
MLLNRIAGNHLADWYFKRFNMHNNFDWVQAAYEKPKPFPHNTFRVVVQDMESIPPAPVYIGKLSKSLLDTLMLKYPRREMQICFFDRNGTFIIYTYSPYREAYRGVKGDYRVISKNGPLFLHYLGASGCVQTLFEQVNK